MISRAVPKQFQSSKYVIKNFKCFCSKPPGPPKLKKTPLDFTKERHRKSRIQSYGTIAFLSSWVIGNALELIPDIPTSFDYTMQYLITGTFPDRPFIRQNRFLSTHFVPREGYYLPYDLYPIKRGIIQWKRVPMPADTTESLEHQDDENLLRATSKQDVTLMHMAAKDAIQQLEDDYKSGSIESTEYEQRKQSLQQLQSDISKI